jgi:hypothetical protein
MRRDLLAVVLAVVGWPVIVLCGLVTAAWLLVGSTLMAATARHVDRSGSVRSGPASVSAGHSAMGWGGASFRLVTLDGCGGTVRSDDRPSSRTDARAHSGSASTRRHV